MKPQGYIYVLRAEGTNLFKIGYSKTVGYRMMQLQAASPLALWIVACQPGTMNGEIRFQERFASYRTHGEWFQLPEYEIDKLYDWGGIRTLEGSFVEYSLIGGQCDCCGER